MNSQATLSVPIMIERAPAKINLTLRIHGRRADGYHLLDSLVVFADSADRLTLTPDPVLSLDVEGPFAAGLTGDTDNLVLKAVRLVREQLPHLQAGHFRLTKNLPLASGIGGGSSDAAAALRLVARLNAIPEDHPVLLDAARATGADVPVCLFARSARMQGIGEQVTPVSLPHPMPCVLVNAGVPVSTRDVFARIGIAAGEQRGQPKPWMLTAEHFLPLLAAEGNDMLAPAVALAPVIGDCLDALRGQGALYASMSGSGATVFGLFADMASAQMAADTLCAAQPRWWIVATTLR